MNIHEFLTSNFVLETHFVQHLFQETVPKWSNLLLNSYFIHLYLTSPLLNSTIHIPCYTVKWSSLNKSSFLTQMNITDIHVTQSIKNHKLKCSLSKKKKHKPGDWFDEVQGDQTFIFGYINLIISSYLGQQVNRH